MDSKAFLRPAGRLSTVAALSAALAATTAFWSPARAADDGQGTILQSVMQLVGLRDTPSTAAPKIDYHARAPLVLPKTMDLPPPARSASARDPAWPKDPDVMAARQADALARAPAQQGGDEDKPMPWTEMAKDRTPPGAQTDSYRSCEMDESQCDPHQLWAQLRIKKGDPGAIPNRPTLVAGVEPTREYLTEPPPGYLTPTQVVKRSWEIPKNKNSEDNSNVYWMEQAGHHVTQDDPSDN